MEGRGLGGSPQGHVPPRWEWGAVRSSSSRGELRKASKSSLPRAHTLRGSIPGAEDGREPPRPGGPWSKPFTALGTRDSPVRGGAARTGQERALLTLPSTSSPEPAPPSLLPGMGPSSGGAHPSAARSWNILPEVTVTVPGVAPEPEPDHGALQGQGIPRGWSLLSLPPCRVPQDWSTGGDTHTELSRAVSVPPQSPPGSRGGSRCLHSPGSIHRLPLPQPLPSSGCSSFSLCALTHPSPRGDDSPPNQPCSTQGGGEPPAGPASLSSPAALPQLCLSSSKVEQQPGCAGTQQKAPNWGMLRAATRAELCPALALWW